jgi:hypothetical protein
MPMRKSHARRPTICWYRSMNCSSGPGRQAVGDPEVEHEQHAEQRREDGGQGDLGAEDAPEHVGLAQGAEPQLVGVEAGDPARRQEQHDHQDDDGDEDDAPTIRQPPAPASSPLRHLRGHTHGGGG